VKLYHNIRKLYTPRGFAAVRGGAMREIEVIENAAILVRDDGTIEYAGPWDKDEIGKMKDEKGSSFISHLSSLPIDCKGLIALPGFVDSHTHCVFAGERSQEFTMRAEGKSYQEIAKTGGGIQSSVEQVRNASIDEIVTYSKPFIERALKLGTTTMEIKSGYGLSTDDERKLLIAAKKLGEETPMQIIRTYLGAHAVPNGISQPNYVTEIIEKQLPALSNEAEFCDVFIDEGYFTKEETIRICRRAKALGMKIKLHADELAETDGARTAVELGAFSADHLLKVSDEGIRALASSRNPSTSSGQALQVTVATLLPITALSLRVDYAPARKMIDAGCAVAIATDCNPGSAMSENMQFAMTLAVIGMQMSPAEALTAATLNGAAALSRANTHGSIERNKLADFVLYDFPQLEYLPYHIAVNDVVAVVKRGNIVSGGHF
jgi:imidazolonepropionase